MVHVKQDPSSVCCNDKYLAFFMPLKTVMKVLAAEARVCPAHFNASSFQKQQQGVVVQLGQGGIMPGTSKPWQMPKL